MYDSRPLSVFRRHAKHLTVRANERQYKYNEGSPRNDNSFDLLWLSHRMNMIDQSLETFVQEWRSPAIPCRTAGRCKNTKPRQVVN